MIEQCAGSADSGTAGIQPARGGANPTPALFFEMGKADDARDLVIRHHYSHRFPENLRFVGTLHKSGGLFGNLGTAVAACVFVTPPTRWAEPVLELSRLVRHDEFPVPLTRLISLSCLYVNRKKVCNLVVSFADWTQGHHGGVYQAASWNYNGQRDSQNDGLIIDGVFWPGRSCGQRWGTRSTDKIRKILGPHHTVEPHFDNGKHLYWKALNREGELQARRLGLESTAYPKPDKGTA